MTNVTHTYSHRQTTNSSNGTLYAPRYEEAFLPIGKSGLISSREVNEARWPHTYSRPCTFEDKKHEITIFQ